MHTRMRTQGCWKPDRQRAVGTKAQRWDRAGRAPDDTGRNLRPWGDLFLSPKCKGKLAEVL